MTPELFRKFKQGKLTFQFSRERTAARKDRLLGVRFTRLEKQSKMCGPVRRAGACADGLVYFDRKFCQHCWTGCDCICALLR